MVDDDANGGASDDTERDADLDLVLHALANPVRRFLLELLIVGPATAGDLAASAHARFGIATSRASQHLQDLAASGLVHVTTDGPRRYYDLHDGAAEPVTAWLRHLGLTR